MAMFGTERKYAGVKKPTTTVKKKEEPKKKPVSPKFAEPPRAPAISKPKPKPVTPSFAEPPRLAPEPPSIEVVPSKPEDVPIAPSFAEPTEEREVALTPQIPAEPTKEEAPLQAGREESEIITKQTQDVLISPTATPEEKQDALDNYYDWLTTSGEIERRASITAMIMAGVGAVAFAGAGLIGMGKAGKLALSKTAFGKVATIGKLPSGAIGAIAINSKTAGLVGKILGKFFSKKTLAFLGASASAIFLGQWGQAEAGEPISITMRDALRQAQETGDWTIYNEAMNARNEITDLATWEKILLWTPAAPFIGITNKIKGAITGGVIMDKVAEKEKVRQETNQTNEDYWESTRKEKAEQEKQNIDYYNEERKKITEWEIEAKKAHRDEDAKFWAKEKEKQRKKEAEDREAIADFWLNYKKEVQKLYEDSRPSNLNFGLL